MRRTEDSAPFAAMRMLQHRRVGCVERAGCCGPGMLAKAHALVGLPCAEELVGIAFGAQRINPVGELALLTRPGGRRFLHALHEAQTAVDEARAAVAAPTAAAAAAAVTASTAGGTGGGAVTPDGVEACGWESCDDDTDNSCRDRFAEVYMSRADDADHVIEELREGLGSSSSSSSSDDGDGADYDPSLDDDDDGSRAFAGGGSNNGAAPHGPPLRTPLARQAVSALVPRPRRTGRKRRTHVVGMRGVCERHDEAPSMLLAPLLRELRRLRKAAPVPPPPPPPPRSSDQGRDVVEHERIVVCRRTIRRAHAAFETEVGRTLAKALRHHAAMGMRCQNRSALVAAGVLPSDSNTSSDGDYGDYGDYGYSSSSSGSCCCYSSAERGVGQGGGRQAAGEAEEAGGARAGTDADAAAAVAVAVAAASPAAGSMQYDEQALRRATAFARRHQALLSKDQREDRKARRDRREARRREPGGAQERAAREQRRALRLAAASSGGGGGGGSGGGGGGAVSAVARAAAERESRRQGTLLHRAVGRALADATEGLRIRRVLGDHRILGLARSLAVFERSAARACSEYNDARAKHRRLRAEHENAELWELWGLDGDPSGGGGGGGGEAAAAAEATVAEANGDAHAEAAHADGAEVATAADALAAVAKAQGAAADVAAVLRQSRSAIREHRDGQLAQVAAELRHRLALAELLAVMRRYMALALLQPPGSPERTDAARLAELTAQFAVRWMHGLRALAEATSAAAAAAAAAAAEEAAAARQLGRDEEGRGEQRQETERGGGGGGGGGDGERDAATQASAAGREEVGAASVLTATAAVAPVAVTAADTSVSEAERWLASDFLPAWLRVADAALRAEAADCPPHRRRGRPAAAAVVQRLRTAPPGLVAVQLVAWARLQGWDLWVQTVLSPAAPLQGQGPQAAQGSGGSGGSAKRAAGGSGARDASAAAAAGAAAAQRVIADDELPCCALARRFEYRQPVLVHGAAALDTVLRLHAAFLRHSRVHHWPMFVPVLLQPPPLPPPPTSPGQAPDGAAFPTAAAAATAASTASSVADVVPVSTPQPQQAPPGRPQRRAARDGSAAAGRPAAALALLGGGGGGSSSSNSGGARGGAEAEGADRCCVALVPMGNFTDRIAGDVFHQWLHIDPESCDTSDDPVRRTVGRLCDMPGSAVGFRCRTPQGTRRAVTICAQARDRMMRGWGVDAACLVVSAERAPEEALQLQTGGWPALFRLHDPGDASGRPRLDFALVALAGRRSGTDGLELLRAPAEDMEAAASAGQQRGVRQGVTRRRG